MNAEHSVQSIIGATDKHQHRRARPPGDQTHRATMLGIKTFRCARAVIAGIETMHMIKKGQLQCPDGQTSSAADKFYPWPSDSKPLLDAV